MTNVDLFDDAFETTQRDAPGAPEGPVQTELAMPAAGTRSRRQRPAVQGPGSAGERHYRLAMRAARRLPRTERRDQTRRLICHHLRCMLEDGPAPHGARR